MSYIVFKQSGKYGYKRFGEDEISAYICPEQYRIECLLWKQSNKQEAWMQSLTEIMVRRELPKERNSEGKPMIIV